MFAMYKVHTEKLPNDALFKSIPVAKRYSAALLVILEEFSNKIVSQRQGDQLGIGWRGNNRDSDQGGDGLRISSGPQGLRL